MNDRQKRKYERKVPYKKPKNVGRPKHAPTDHTRTIVRLGTAIGLTQEEIARHVGIGVDTMARAYRDEITWGLVGVKALVAGTLIQQATGGALTAGAAGGDWQKAVPASTMFFLKTRAGLRETVQHAGPTGGPIEYRNLGKLTDAELVALETIRAKLDGG